MCLVVWIFSSVAAPTKMKAILTISDGWKENPPIWTQLYAPFLFDANMSPMARSPMAMTSMGTWNFSTRSMLASIHRRATYSAKPRATARNWVKRELVPLLATTASPMPVRKNATNSMAGLDLRSTKEEVIDQPHSMRR